MANWEMTGGKLFVEGLEVPDNIRQAVEICAQHLGVCLSTILDSAVLFLMASPDGEAIKVSLIFPWCAEQI